MMPRRVSYNQKLVFALAALLVVCVSGRFLSITPYKLQTKMLPVKSSFSQIYAGPYSSIIGSSDCMTEKHGYALQLGRFQVSVMKTTSVTPYDGIHVH